MQKVSVVLVVMMAACFLFGSLSVVAGENLVKNPYFTIDESPMDLWPDDWSIEWAWVKKGCLKIDMGITHGDGDGSLKVMDATIMWGGRAFQDIPVVPGRKYQFSGWIKAENFEGWAAYRIHWQYADGSFSDTLDPFGRLEGGTFDWTEQSGVLEVPDNAVMLRLNAFGSPDKGTLWFSDVSLVEVED